MRIQSGRNRYYGVVFYFWKTVEDSWLMEEYRESRPRKHRSTTDRSKAETERSNERFPPTGSFGELEQRQGLHAINRILRGRNANEWGNLKTEVR